MNSSCQKTVDNDCVCVDIRDDDVDARISNSVVEFLTLIHS